MTDRLIRITTALAVATVAAVAAVISYRHAYDLARTHGETGPTASLLPFTVDGLILAASMLILDASRRHQAAPALARWCLGAGIAATTGANLAHGLGHGPIGALVSAWPALALAGSFELLMTLIRTSAQDASPATAPAPVSTAVPAAEHDAPAAPADAPAMARTVRAWHNAGRSQGEFNWSSHHFDHGGVRWGRAGSRCRRRPRVLGGSGRRIGRCGRRCGHRAGLSRLVPCSGSSGG
jgi:Protein of unknown function (DUF2637)